jgi:hypothetical protein
MLPDIAKVEGGHAAIYDTPRYNRFRRMLARVIARKWGVAGSVVAIFVLAILGMGLVKKQFFPTSDRPEVLVEVQMPYGTSIGQTSAAAQNRGVVAKTAGSENGYRLYWPGLAAFLSGDGARVTRPVVCKIVVLTDSSNHAMRSNSDCGKPWPTGWRLKRACA